MDAVTSANVVVKNGPPLAVVGAGFTDWFMHFPISEALQWASLIWILVQLGFYLYEKYRKYTDGSIL